MERDPFKPTDAKPCQAVFVVQPSELALDSPAATVELPEPLRLARDERVQAGRLDPDARGLAPPVGRATSRVRTVSLPSRPAERVESPIKVEISDESRSEWSSLATEPRGTLRPDMER
jgi:hypothetical protein